MPSNPIQLPNGNLEFPVSGVGDAVRLAQLFRDNGHFDLFRGQTRKWPLAPTLHRFGVDREAESRRFQEFGRWVHSNSELETIWGRGDAICAIAQHYGFSTPFLDFSRGPFIAGFFSCDPVTSSQATRVTERACIACLNSRDVERAWHERNKINRDSNGFDLLQIVDVPVNNLWRLQAQQGVFLDVHIDATLFESTTPIAWITFPHSVVSLVDRDLVYPENRSPLESLLDQFFVTEKYPARAESMREMASSLKLIFTKVDRVDDANFFIGSTLPDDDPSWRSDILVPWFNDLTAPLPNIPDKRELLLRVEPQGDTNSIYQAVYTDVLLNLADPNLRYDMSTEWLLVDLRGNSVVPLVESVGYLRYSNPEFDDLNEEMVLAQKIATPKALSGSLSQIFDGMRYLPYTNYEIAAAMSTYVCMSIKGGYDAINELFGSTVTIEMSSGGMKTSCILSEQGISQAIRNNWPSLVYPENLKDIQRENVRMILGVLANPRKLFLFDQFKELFAEQIIASQAFCRQEAGEIVFNPAKVEIFGLG